MSEFENALHLLLNAIVLATHSWSGIICIKKKNAERMLNFNYATYFNNDSQWKLL